MKYLFAVMAVALTALPAQGQPMAPQPAQRFDVEIGGAVEPRFGETEGAAEQAEPKESEEPGLQKHERKPGALERNILKPVQKTRKPTGGTAGGEGGSSGSPGPAENEEGQGSHREGGKPLSPAPAVLKPVKTRQIRSPGLIPTGGAKDDAPEAAGPAVQPPKNPFGERVRKLKQDPGSTPGSKAMEAVNNKEPGSQGLAGDMPVPVDEEGGIAMPGSESQGPEVGDVNDDYEQEADNLGNKVMSNPQPISAADQKDLFGNKAGINPEDDPAGPFTAPASPGSDVGMDPEDDPGGPVSKQR